MQAATGRMHDHTRAHAHLLVGVCAFEHGQQIHRPAALDVRPATCFDCAQHGGQHRGAAGRAPGTRLQHDGACVCACVWKGTGVGGCGYGRALVWVWKGTLVWAGVEGRYGVAVPHGGQHRGAVERVLGARLQRDGKCGLLCGMRMHECAHACEECMIGVIVAAHVVSSMEELRASRLAITPQEERLASTRGFKQGGAASNTLQLHCCKCISKVTIPAACAVDTQMLRDMQAQLPWSSSLSGTKAHRAAEVAAWLWAHRWVGHTCGRGTQ
eukprot:575588-Pelagomonas_calceolata.AAC.2